MHGATTMAKCAIGVARQVTTSRIVIASGIAVTAYAAAMMALTVFALTISVTSSKTVRSTLLTPTLNVATALPLTTTLMSKGR